jgi:serine phosphatase RsbU (regulator of sigma subunit)
MPSPPAVLLVVDPASTQTDARQILEKAGFGVQLATFDATDPKPGQFRHTVVDSSGAPPRAAGFCRRWCEHRGNAESAIVWLADSPEDRMAGWQAGADAVLGRPLAFGELPAQIERLTIHADERKRLSQRANESTQINQTLLQLYQQSDVDFRIARRIQRACRPTQLPAVGRARFTVSHRERVGSPGDFHNVLRVDEDRVAFFLGEVMGQSLTSCMLAVFIHQNVGPKEITGQTYRVLPPEEVLHRLGRALAMLGIPDPPLVRLTYGLLNSQTGELSFACAGHTPPLRLPAIGPAEFWRAPGPMLAPSDTHYTAQSAQLRPGDRILLFTDGLPGATPQPLDNLRAAVEARRELPLPGLVASVTQDLLTQTLEPDDFTLLGLEFV